MLEDLYSGTDRRFVTQFPKYHMDHFRQYRTLPIKHTKDPLGKGLEGHPTAFSSQHRGKELKPKATHLLQKRPLDQGLDQRNLVAVFLERHGVCDCCAGHLLGQVLGQTLSQKHFLRLSYLVGRR